MTDSIETAERLTVNLTAKASAALHREAKESGDSLTDVVNRALQVYGLVSEAWRKSEVEDD